jgi:hypothetical protein
MSFPSEKMKWVREEIEKREWFGFALDDTLYDRRKTDAVCAKEMLFKLGDRHGVTTLDIQIAHKNIMDLNLGPWWEFIFYDDSADQARKAIFEKILRELEIDTDDWTLGNGFHEYRQVCEDNVELKSGALSLIQYLKSIGKKILVIHDIKGWCAVGYKDARP